ncbi:MAG: glucose-1-phosphate adenylyltransferase, partial [Vicinamibacteria bacterium]|nr:glucose-1-phosphate adenylyltransferase [Vicinamibacteria bacterium]
DFGRHVIPGVISHLRVHAHLHRGYWEDVGTIRSYFEANLALCQSVPPFDFYDVSNPIYTHPRFLPATKVEDCCIKRALISEGSIVVGSEIEHSVIGIRARIGRGTQIRDSLVLGADYYETLNEITTAETKGLPPVGIGAGSVITGAIIDKNARIGRGVRLNEGPRDVDSDGDGYFVRDGIVVIPKNAVILDGTVI